MKRALIIQHVFSKENMQLTQTDLNQELFHMAAEYGVELDEMVKLLQKNQAVDELQFRSIQRKVRAFLLEKAHITESKTAVGDAKPKREKAEKTDKSDKAEAAAKPAKKPAAKKTEAKADAPKAEAAPKKKAPAKKKAE